ncbi:MAG TPA: phospholipid carrier-dependent glycosyltransferase [Actinomycetota bacterium]
MSDPWTDRAPTPAYRAEPFAAQAWPSSSDGPERRGAFRRALLIVLVITAAAGFSRFWTLGRPAEKVFDEVYYASDACLYAGHPFEACGLESEAERSWVHPPLGKWLIALGIDAFGNDPFGWRFTAALAGTTSVALAGAFAFLLWGRPLWAGVAALLLATEHLHVVQSRVAMLDIFLAFFVLLGFTLLLWDRVRQKRLDAVVAANEATPFLAPPGPRWIRVAAGASFAAATASKWSGIFAWLGGLVLAVMWERGRRARAGVERPLLSALRQEWASLALAFIAAPLLVYLASWLRWLGDHGWSLPRLWSNHLSMANYHLGLEPFTESGEPIHPYMSEAWTWLLLLRPVAYYYESMGDRAAEILGIGNPVLFWGALVFLPYLAFAWVRRRDWRAGAILVPVFVLFAPWLFVTRPLFLFYMVPVTPFLALGATYALRDVSRLRGAGRPAPRLGAAVAVAVAVGLFVFFWPVLIGDPISKRAWDARIWFSGWI